MESGIKMSDKQLFHLNKYFLITGDIPLLKKKKKKRKEKNA